MVVGWIATALVAYRAGAYVERKSDVPEKYRQLVGDRWSGLVTEVFALCQERYGYRLPPEGSDFERLKDLCREALAFENHFIALYREFTEFGLSD